MVKYLLVFVLLTSFATFAQNNSFIEFNGTLVRPSEANSGLGYSFKYQRELSESTALSVSFSNWNWDRMKNFRGYDGQGIITEFYNNNKFYPVLAGIETNIHGDKDFRSFFTFEMGMGYIDYQSAYQTEYYFENNSWGVGSIRMPEPRNQWLFLAGVGFGFSHRAWEIVDLKVSAKVYKIGGDYEKFGELGSIYILSNFGFSVLI